MNEKERKMGGKGRRGGKEGTGDSEGLCPETKILGTPLCVIATRHLK
jgi:hypothetical protein